MNSWSRGTVAESANNVSDPCIVRKVTSQAVQIEGSLKATNTTAPDPFVKMDSQAKGRMCQEATCGANIAKLGHFPCFCNTKLCKYFLPKFRQWQDSKQQRKTILH